MNLVSLYSYITRSKFFMVLGGIVLVGACVVLFARPSARAAVYTGIPNTDFNNLEQEIQNLQSRVATLENEVRVLQSGAVVVNPPSYSSTTYANPPPYTATTVNPPYTNPPTYNYGYATTYGPASINQNGGTYNAGWDIYFTGRGFAPNETVLIFRNGALTGNARADSAGNISSAGVYLPFGTYTYTFVGQQSGVTATAIVTGARNL